jgi:carboxylate-amine ligase
MDEHPTIGVEEEFLLVDNDTGEPVAANQAVAAQAEARGVQLQLELTSCQVETTSRVVATSDELRAELTRLRCVAADAASACGARLLAVALPPSVPHHFPITDTPRYRKIGENFGMIAHEQGSAAAMFTSRYQTGRRRSRSATGCGHGYHCFWR